MSAPVPPRLFAVDVGTLSARAGLFTADGTLIAAAAEGFSLNRPDDHRATYRMDDIWRAVGVAARACLAGAPEGADGIAALAFDATSSLVLDHPAGPPLDNGDDVICWMDHRGEAEAALIDATGHPFLAYHGGSVSPEMHLPKLLWLKRAAPAAFDGLAAVRDLCDELARRATGLDRHSVCGLACKWPYLPAEADPWRRDLLDRLGLAALTGFGALERPAGRVGERHGALSAAAAAHLGLGPGLPVAIGLIDAEAGALGVLGRDFRSRMNRVLPMIGGTSTNYMPFAPEPRMIPGVWGPFKDAVFPDTWMHEGGQSLSGAALDAVLAHHPASPGRPSAETHAAAARGVTELLDREGAAFAARRHVVPDWLGNRSPLGDGRVRALLTGIGPETGPRSFLEAYYATARGLAMQSRHVAEHLDAHGFAIDEVALSGGHRRNPLLVRLYRDALGADLVLSQAEEPVLLGTAMVAAVAAGLAPDLFAAVDAMAAPARRVAADPAWRAAHDGAYRIYRELFSVRNAIEAAARALEQPIHP